MPMTTGKATDYLRRDQLRTVSLLKYLQAFPGDTRLLHAEGAEGEAVLLLLRVAASDYDRHAYPDAHHVCFIASDHPDLTLRLVEQLPEDGVIVFKLATPADERAVGERFRLRRRTAFHSFRMADASGWTDVPGLVRAVPSEAGWRLFEERGYTRNWLMPLLVSGRAFVVEAPQQEAALSTCFAFENSPGLWEIGGLSTHPAARRRGLARQVVQAAFREVERCGLVARYVVEETNTASLALARSLGLCEVQCLTHFLAEGRR